LYYYRERFYDPQLGRFITQDPIGHIGGTNLYTYVGNNPVSYSDPLGLLLGEMGPTIGVFFARNDREVEMIGYLDFNVTAGKGFGATAGIMINDEGLYPYIGPALVTSPGVAITMAPMDDPCHGWNFGIQPGFFFGGQFGYGGDELFWEIGFVSPGLSVAPYYVFGPYFAPAHKVAPGSSLK